MSLCPRHLDSFNIPVLLLITFQSAFDCRPFFILNLYISCNTKNAN